MKSTLLLLSLTCALGQVDGGEWSLTPKLYPGEEIVYSGTCTEESLDPSVRFKNLFQFENRFFVLAGDVRGYDVALITSLSAQEPFGERRFKSVSVKLDLARVDPQGRVKTAGNVNVPIGTPPFLEIGNFVEVPLNRVGKSSAWEAPEEGRPPRSWLVLGSEICDGYMCAKLLGQQQSDDWDRPRADRTAWRRRDVVWVWIQSGVAVKVERTFERRDPARREPSHRTTTQYSLATRFWYREKNFDDRKLEILQAKRFSDDASRFLKQPNQNAANIDVLLRKIAIHLESAPPTPYRKAITHLTQRVESARRGELLLQADYTVEEPAVPIGPLRVGQKAPDTLLTDLVTGKTSSLNKQLGRPILFVYYNPQTKIGVDVLQFARAAAAKMGDRMGVLAMAVTTDLEIAQRQHADLRLPFPILDGSALRLAFAVEATPRFIVLDADGYVRAATTGWAPQVGEELLEEIRAISARPVGAP